METDRLTLLRKELKEFDEQFTIDETSFISFKYRISPLLDKAFQNRMLSLIIFDENEKERTLSFESQSYISALLQDQIRFITQPSKTKTDLEINKLLKARIENFDFELELAVMITGDNELFPLRTSYYLTKFFKELGFDFTHNGGTKRFWVESQLKKLNIEQIHYIIVNGIFREKNFLEFKKGVALAKQCFADFIEKSIEYNKIIDISDTFNLNVRNELLFNQYFETDDKTLNILISNARTLFLQGNIQLSIEKIWDALERIKTSLNKDKKKGIKTICEQLSDEIDMSFFDNEYRVLTDLGNEYQIRHFETDKKPIANLETKKYLFFRALSLINLTLSRIENV